MSEALQGVASVARDLLVWVVAFPVAFFAGEALGRFRTSGSARLAQSYAWAAPILLALIALIMSWSRVSWQVSLDSSLTQAGTVEYILEGAGRDYWYQWNLLSQLGAVLLRLEFSEWSISFTIVWLSAFPFLLGGYLIILAITRNSFYGLIASLLLVIYQPTAVLAGATYGAQNLGTPHTFGAVGIAWLTMVIGLSFAGKWTTAACFAGILLAIHPVYGVAAVAFVAVALCMLWLADGTRPGLGKPALGFVVGLTVSATSLAAYALLRPDPTTATGSATMSTYFQLWDYHRRPTLTVSVLPIVVSLLCALTALILSRTSAAKGAVRAGLLTAAIVSCVVPGLYLYHVLAAQSGIVNFITAFQLGRLTLVPGYLLGPFLAALLGIGLRPLLDRFVWSRRTPSASNAKSGILVALLVVVAILPSARVEAGAIRARWTEATPPPPPCPLEAARLVLAAPSLSLDVYRACRLPIAFDAASIDFIPYMPNALNAVARVIEVGYGIDFENPPIDSRHRGAVGDETTRSIWESRDVADWAQVRKELGVDMLAAPSDWNIDLTPVGTASNSIGPVAYYLVPN